MIVDYIKFAYEGTMRAYDGSLFRVKWAIVTDPNASTLPFAQPFASGRYTPYGFDDGGVGELPNHHPVKSNLRVPARVCGNCYAGVRGWWVDGWPIDTPPVILGPDGFAVECGPRQTGAYDCGYDYGYDSGGQC